MQGKFQPGAFIIFLFVFAGALAGIIISPFLSMTGIQIILGAGAFLLAAGIYTAVRIYISNQRKLLRTPAGADDRSEVGFVVDTFHELVEKLKDKEKELERLKSLAEDRAMQLAELSAGIAHELRNPMSVIAGYAKLLSKRIDNSNKPTVDAILNEIQGMDRIISELLAFTKPADIHKMPVNINKLVEETAGAVVSGNNLIKLIVNTDAAVTISADELLLRQALTNLFRNAAEAMPEGGELSVNLSIKRNTAEIIVRDTGHGISENIRQKIFLPFFTTKEKGTGLGLALVRKVIAAHGGNIEVQSAGDAGTAFRITLPAGK
ncbi:MAG: hypothetical protein HY759_02590 [Nitrospirae bacterium]|nr:hypothetical protein [Nitrospirota bacterium]